MSRSGIHKRVARSIFTLTLTLAAATHPGVVRAERFAVLVGNNRGRAGDPPLRYAETDTARIAAALQLVGGFAVDNTIVLNGQGPRDLRITLAGLGAQLARLSGEHVLFFYYSGHADGSSIHMGGESFTFAELKSLVTQFPASVRILIVDACQSGALTRIKGGRPGTPFFVAPDEPTRGLAILASASGAELAQESDALGGSFFSHHFEAGLRGMADINRDGQVTLSEAFAYASNSTVTATWGTAAGPQHPAFRYDLTGTYDPILTRPASNRGSHGRIVFDRTGWYLLKRVGGFASIELRSTGGQSLALEPGEYDVDRRETDRLEVAKVDLAPSTTVLMSQVRTNRLAFGRYVRKGTETERVAYAGSVAALARTALLSLGTAKGIGAAARIDWPMFSLELRTAATYAVSDTFVSSKLWEGNVTLAALRAWDTRHVTLLAGLGLGWALLRQQLGSGSAVTAHAAIASPTAVLELPWGGRFSARTEVALPFYLLPSNSDDEGPLLRWGLQLGLGVGSYF